MKEGKKWASRLPCAADLQPSGCALDRGQIRLHGARTCKSDDLPDRQETATPNAGCCVVWGHGVHLVAEPDVDTGRCGTGR